MHTYRETQGNRTKTSCFIEVLIHPPFASQGVPLWSTVSTAKQTAFWCNCPRRQRLGDIWHMENAMVSSGVSEQISPNRANILGQESWSIKKGKYKQAALDLTNQLNRRENRNATPELEDHYVDFLTWSYRSSGPGVINSADPLYLFICFHATVQKILRELGVRRPPPPKETQERNYIRRFINARSSVISQLSLYHR